MKKGIGAKPSPGFVYPKRKKDLYLIKEYLKKVQEYGEDPIKVLKHEIQHILNLKKKKETEGLE